MPKPEVTKAQRRLYKEHRELFEMFPGIVPRDIGKFQEAIGDKILPFVGGGTASSAGRGLRRVFKKYSKLSNLDDKHAEKVLDKALDVASKSAGGPKDVKGKESALRWALGYPSSKGHRYHKIPEQLADKSLSPRDAASITRELDMDKTWAEGVLEDTIKGMKLK